MQFSLFGAAALGPTLADVEGVLLAGGHWVRAPGSNPTHTAARLSVVVADRWRAEALAAAFAERAVGGEAITIDDGFAARTDFRAELVPYAEAWTRGANEGPPSSFVLTAGGLRLWAIASGTADGLGYLLGTDDPDDAIHRVAGAQLARMGLAAASIGRGAAGWRIVSAKRLRRLAELLGEPPAGATDWPG